ncbi:hypothetical protein SAMN05421819_2156 [Bryocella elongata]|uniref:Uncharacterized protein n=1 Tax=Bryocella elongata TaxID=863522 RepID=A0A1H5Y820_9BACT|nr:hypothetical protein [Bryocella elongata]SEG19807.1 hypothetical protein SAMN05421819_2156 [Bryocella elongata]
MGYLTPADYPLYGLPEDTADAWVTMASAMMEGFCRRPSLLSASYTERMRVPVRAQRVRLSYGPLISVDAVQAKYAVETERHDPLISAFAGAFGLPGAWVTVDPTTLDVSLPTGEFQFTWNLLGLRYGEAEVTYTAGLTVVPDTVKAACAQIVRNAQATPGLNVKSARMDTLQTEYFSDSLLDAQVQSMLRPYVAERLG